MPKKYADDRILTDRQREALIADTFRSLYAAVELLDRHLAALSEERQAAYGLVYHTRHPMMTVGETDELRGRIGALGDGALSRGLGELLCDNLKKHHDALLTKALLDQAVAQVTGNGDA